MNTYEEIQEREKRIKEMRIEQEKIEVWLRANIGNPDWLKNQSRYCLLSVKVMACRHRIARLKSNGDNYGLEEVSLPRNMIKMRI